MPSAAEISRANPTCFVFFIDPSAAAWCVYAAAAARAPSALRSPAKCAVWVNRRRDRDGLRNDDVTLLCVGLFTMSPQE